MEASRKADIAKTLESQLDLSPHAVQVIAEGNAQLLNCLINRGSLGLFKPTCSFYLFPAWLNGAFQSGVGTGVVGNEKVPTRSLLILTSESSYDSSAVLVPNAVNVHFMTFYYFPPPSNDSHLVGNQKENLWIITLDMSERCGQRTVYRGQPFFRSRNFRFLSGSRYLARFPA